MSRDTSPDPDPDPDGTDSGHTDGTQRRVSLATWAAVALVVMSLAAGIAAAQQIEQTWSDDFEDGDVDGWTDDNPTVQADSASTEGDWSLYIESTSSSGNGYTEWADGPYLDMRDDFEITATFKHNKLDGTNADQNVRIGIQAGNDLSTEEHALLVFSDSGGDTYLTNGSDDRVGHNTVNDAFTNEWVHVRIWSDAGSSELNASVWTVDQTEPSDPMMNETFEGTAGPFSVNVGSGPPNERQAWLDSIEVVGYEAIDPNMTIETSNYLRHGKTQPYNVTIEEYNETQGRNVTRDITAEANVTSLDADGITVDQSNHRLIATSDTSYADRVQIRAEYNDSVAYTYVSVANETVANAEVLPPTRRYTAALGDSTIFALIIATLVGVVGARVSTSFGGLGASTMTLTIAGFAGWVGMGFVAFSVFVAMFIGLNLAANIDYQVRR